METFELRERKRERERENERKRDRMKDWNANIEDTMLHETHDK